MIRNPRKELDDGVVRIREIRAQDSEDLYRWRMHPRIRTGFRNNEVGSKEDHEQLISGYFSAENTDCWFIAEARGFAIGTLALVKFSTDCSECELGRVIIAPEYWGLSYARRALRLLAEYGWLIGVRRIRAEIWDQNRPALAQARRLGFVKDHSYVYRARRFLVFVLRSDRQQ